MDLIKTIRANLVADTDITDLVSAVNIRVHDNPVNTATKQILLEETFGKSDSVLNVESGIFTIWVYVRDSVDEPYKTLKQIKTAVLSCLDKKNESLKDSDSFVRHFVKSSGEPIHSNGERYWMATLVFDYIVGE